MIRLKEREGTGVKFNLHASEESPLVHPVFVFENWGESDPEVVVNGEPLKPGSGFRYGFRKTLKGTDLVLWTNVSSKKQTIFRIYPEPFIRK